MRFLSIMILGMALMMNIRKVRAAAGRYLIETAEPEIYPAVDPEVSKNKFFNLSNTN